MSVPDYQSFFLPLLKRLSDGHVRDMKDIYEQLATDFALSDADRAEVLPSGQFTYRNRIGWARTYLKKAGLVESPQRGRVRITDSGEALLNDPPAALDVGYLRRYPSFVEFVTSTAPNDESSAVSPSAGDVATDKTPEEMLQNAYQGLRRQLESELLEKIKQAPPEFFERLVLELLLRMGYGGSREDAGRTVGKSGDGGIDGVINEDPLGLDTVCIQAKRWEGNVGRPTVQAFAGSLEGFRARKGVLITTSSFSKDAVDYVRQIEKRIVLIDGEKLCALLVQHDLGVSTVVTYPIKRIDSDYFDEE
jgi:restriction system protein